MTRFAGETREAYRGFLQRLEKRHRAGASGVEIARLCADGVETIVVHLYEALR